jgi:hypothetical protein
LQNVSVRDTVILQYYQRKIQPFPDAFSSKAENQHSAQTAFVRIMQVHNISPSQDCEKRECVQKAFWHFPKCAMVKAQSGQIT